MVHRESFDFGKIKTIKEIYPPVPIATNAMRSFDLSLKDGQCILDENLLSINGWLNQQGQLFACGWLQHDKSVKSFGYANERDATKAGVIRLANMKWQVEKRFAGTVSISKEQYTTIRRWHETNSLNSEYFDYCSVKARRNGQ